MNYKNILTVRVDIMVPILRQFLGHKKTKFKFRNIYTIWLGEASESRTNFSSGITIDAVAIW